MIKSSYVKQTLKPNNLHSDKSQVGKTQILSIGPPLTKLLSKWNFIELLKLIKGTWHYHTFKYTASHFIQWIVALKCSIILSTVCISMKICLNFYTNSFSNDPNRLTLQIKLFLSWIEYFESEKFANHLSLEICKWNIIYSLISAIKL